MKETELKPCPFCGSEAKVINSGKVTFYIGCENGCAKTTNYTVYNRTEPKKTYEKTEKIQWAVDAWNRRADNEQREAD